MAVLSDAGQLLANQPDQSAVSAPPAPPAPSVSGGILNAAQQAAPSSQPTPPSPTSAQQQDSAHHELLGRVVKHIVGAANGVDYAPDGQGGVKPVPAKPGSFFRNLAASFLVSSVAGAAAGAQSKTFAGGFGAGAQAGAAQAERMDQLKYDRARQAVEDQQKQQQVSDEHTLHQAMVAHDNLQTASLLHDLWASDQDRIQKLNAANHVYRQAMIDQGGVPAKFRVGNQTVDSLPADQFARLYTQDSSIAHSPDTNSERHFISNTDLSEIDFDGQSWRDESGNEIALGPRTTISAIDMPTNSMKTYAPVDGTVLNTLAHGQIVPDAGKKYSVNGLGLTAIRNLGLKAMAEDTRAAAQRTKAARQEQTNKQFTQIESKKAAALARSEADYWRNINSGKDENNALSQLNAAKQDAQDAYENEIRAAGGTPQHFSYNGASAPQARPNQPQNRQRVTPPRGKSVVYDPQNNPHFVDAAKLNAFLSDPQYKGWHQ